MKLYFLLGAIITMLSNASLANTENDATPVSANNSLQSAVERKLYKSLSAPVGPYSHAVQYNGLLFLSGLTAYETPAQYGNIVEQADAILQQINKVIKEENQDFQSLIKVTIFITDATDIYALRQILSSYYGNFPPASSMVQIKQLFSPELKIEIEAIFAIN